MSDTKTRVRVIGLTFNFSNKEVIPLSVRILKEETMAGMIKRKKRGGEAAIQPTEKCSLVDFAICDLKEAGFELVDAHYQERRDYRDLSGKRTYHSVHFLFAHKDFVYRSFCFEKTCEYIVSDLRDMCCEALWRVRGFVNPYYQKGEIVPGQLAVSLNFEARQPLYLPDRTPVVVWKKNNRGERIGDAPQPIEPDWQLAIKDGDICLLPYPKQY